MSDSTIRPGDLAQVVRGCGCYTGFIEVVAAVLPGRFIPICSLCGAVGLPQGMVEWADWKPGKLNYAPLSWVKKIPPLSDRESLDEIMSAPVLPESVSA